MKVNKVNKVNTTPLGRPGGVSMVPPSTPKKRISTVTRSQPAWILGFLVILRLHATVMLWLRLHLGLRPKSETGNWPGERVGAAKMRP